MAGQATNIQVIVEELVKNPGAVKALSDQLAALKSAGEKGAAGVHGAKEEVSGLGKAMELLREIAPGLITALTFIGVIEAFREMTAEALHTIHEVGLLGEEFGVTAEKMSVLRNAFEQKGLGGEQLQVAMRTFSLALEAANEPTTRQAQALGALGINANDAAFKVLSLDEKMAVIGDRFGKYADGSTKAAVATALFGRHVGVEMIPLLNNFAAVQDQATEAQNKWGGVTTQSVAAERALREQVNELKEVLHGLFVTFAIDLLPILTEFTRAFKSLAEDNAPLLKGAMDEIVVVLRGVALIGLAVFDTLDRIGLAIITVAKAAGSAAAGDFAAAYEEFQKFSERTAEMTKQLDESAKKILGLSKPAPVLDEGKSQLPALTALQDVKRQLLQLDQERVPIEVAYQAALIRTQGEVDRGEKSEVARQRELVERAGDVLRSVEQEEAAINGLINERTSLLEQQGRFTDKTAQEIQAILAEDVVVAELTKKIQALWLEREKLVNAASAVPDSWTKGLIDFGHQMDAATTKAAIFGRIMSTAVSGISQAFEKLVFETRDWGVAFANVGRQVVGALIQIGVQMVAQHIIAMILHKEQDAATNKSIIKDSYGAAVKAMKSVADIPFVGWILAPIAFAAILGLGLAAAAYEEGGLVAGGQQLIRVNEAGKEYVVDNATLNRIGVPFFEHLRSGGTPETALVGSPRLSPVNLGRNQGAGDPNGRTSNVHVGFINDRQDQREFMARDGFRVVMDKMSKRISVLNT